MNFLPPQLRAVDPAFSKPDDDVWTHIETALWRSFPQRSVRRVLFVAPPDAQRERFSVGVAKRGRYHNYPPYGVAVVASHLRRDGVEVQIPSSILTASSRKRWRPRSKTSSRT
jgi:hypothetical protein